MIKNIFKIALILSFVSSLKADYLMTLVMNDKQEDYIFSRCVTYYDTSDSKLYYTKSYDNTMYYKLFKDIKDYKIVSGYYLNDDGICEKYTNSLSDTSIDSSLPLISKNLTYLGLTDSDLNMMFAFSGILTSFLFLFGLFRWI